MCARFMSVQVSGGRLPHYPYGSGHTLSAPMMFGSTPSCYTSHPPSPTDMLGPSYVTPPPYTQLFQGTLDYTGTAFDPFVQTGTTHQSGLGEGLFQSIFGGLPPLDGHRSVPYSDVPGSMSGFDTFRTMPTAFSRPTRSGFDTSQS
ncbi:hypothetical protein L6452_08468 [Arctium lappa]|uniref:Uncharacterized protein n=1 Tax=Arctium lappa TaxID=4217 RepID=A0ACB9DHB7_ARCLA|nr:hypothetical protein L6452_08468 [Arctium lappa]